MKSFQELTKDSKGGKKGKSKPSENSEDAEDGDAGKAGTFLFGEDLYNSEEFVHRKHEMQSLGKAIAALKGAPFRITQRLKEPKWDMKWSTVQDAMLMRGAYENGCGNWEPVRDDPSLNLSAILPLDTSKKPQKSHLDARIATLLKLCYPYKDASETKKSASAATTTKATSKKQAEKAEKAEKVAEVATTVVPAKKSTRTRQAKITSICSLM
jgi:hypothetical protein